MLIRLLDVRDLDCIEFYDGADTPAYAILSHTWSVDEYTYNDFRNDAFKEKQGYKKLRSFANQAMSDGFSYIWMDTCCINKVDHLELTEAINSMFRWYQQAGRCYIYLEDVGASTDPPDDWVELKHTGKDASSNIQGLDWESQFRRSRWFTRGWTLQELIAPREAAFFDREWRLLGTRDTLRELLGKITNIHDGALQGVNVSTYAVQDRLSWASGRQTTRVEDSAYCLLGILGVYMPLIYGEGEYAFERLISEVQKKEEREKSLKDQARIKTAQIRADLPLPSQHLRIITLEKGERDDPLRGSLLPYSFSERPDYFALSYTWGDEPDLHPIALNGRTRYIRSNLYHALKRLRLPSATLHLWVDSICIRQEDQSEKESQVRQMAQIHRNAAGVMVWLGEKDSTSDMALDLIPRLNDRRYRWKHDWWADYGFSALSQLLDRPWFSRRWVVQEASVSTNTTILCGDRSISMKAFSGAVNLIRFQPRWPSSLDAKEQPSSSFDFLDTFRSSPATQLLDIIKDIVKETTLPLEILVDRAKFSITTDRRDVIYSLLSLAGPLILEGQQIDASGQLTVVEPDYKKTVLDVYAEFVEQCIHRTVSLDIICLPWAPPYRRRAAHNTETSIDTPSLPSWISTTDRLPYGDPYMKKTYRQNGKVFVSAQCKVYTCGSRRRPVVDLRKVPDPNQSYVGTLSARGIVLGTIAKTSMRMAGAVIAKECFEILLPPDPGTPRTSSSIPDVIWRTLCADRDDKGKPAPIEYRLAMTHALQMSSESPKVLSQTSATDALDSFPGIDVEELLEMNLGEHVRAYLEVVRDVIWNRRTFRGRSEPDLDELALVGLAPQGAKAGDKVCLLHGCSVPVILRATGLTWFVIGEAYVDGIMDGDIIGTRNSALLTAMERDFELR